MADGTIEGLRACHAVQTYWDVSKLHYYATLRYDPIAAEWLLGALVFREDYAETTHAQLVLRSALNNGKAVKIVIPQAKGSLTSLAAEKGIMHICPFYMGTPGKLEYQGSLIIFKDRVTA